MPRILSKKMKKDVSWAQMGRNRKLIGQVKSLEEGQANE
ncbi:MAG: hypothetical protein MRERV_4c098 [Mycoplasmataceae bacterium RV_VA103A]|nr:MAG: hypothetical protein MRERV_11c053 [Mycoplasmataceae bacterium RV_VA103A]KLL05188.1 MAG: hypothetical protein MRERV_4c098 [Mycoplasmataceae bacterium RV_VA103A]